MHREAHAAMTVKSLLGIAAAALIAASCANPSSTIDLPVTPRSHTFNVRAYGAAGNGFTDDTTAIRKALVAATLAGGGTIYFPVGVYIIDPASGPFPVSSHLTIVGSGSGSILRVRNHDGPYNLIFGQPPRRIADVAFLHLRVDQNPQGNRGSNINPFTDAENVVQLYDFEGVTVEDVAFDPEPGVQAIVLAGPHASAATVKDCAFRFRRGASSNPFYDNSSVYTEASQVTVSRNHFLSTNEQNAVTAIEVHGGPDIEVSENEAREFQVGLNIVNSTQGYPDVKDAHAVVHDNRLLDTTQAFALWSVTGRTLRDVTIEHNTITMQQHRQYYDTWLGVSFVRGPKSAGIDGAFDDVTVEDNIVDFRPLYSERIATLQSIGIDASPKGPLDHFVVRHNQIIGSPATGVQIGVEAIRPQLRNVEVTDNTISDAGWDRHATGLSRAAVLVGQAWLTDVHVDRNTIVDTGRFRDLNQAFSAWAHPRPNSRNITLRNDRIVPQGVMRYSVNDRLVNDRGTRP
jgi:hypothetical protein